MGGPPRLTGLNFSFVWLNCMSSTSNVYSLWRKEGPLVSLRLIPLSQNVSKIQNEENYDLTPVFLQGRYPCSWQEAAAPVGIELQQRSLPLPIPQTSGFIASLTQRRMDWGFTSMQVDTKKVKIFTHYFPPPSSFSNS